MSALIKTDTIAQILGVSRKTVLERAKKEHWAMVAKQNSFLFVENRLPLDVRFSLAGNKTQAEQQVDTGGAFINASDEAREKATWKSALIFAYKQSGLRKQDYIDAYNADSSGEIYKRLGEVSLKTFYRWCKDFAEQGVSALVPRYGISRTGAGESLNQTERDLLTAFWLKSTQPTASHAFRQMRECVPFSNCSYQTALRFLQTVPPLVRDFYRLGKSRFENNCLPYMEQDIYRYHSLDVVVSDHHCLDCIVMYQGRLIRPWVTTFQDYRSGKILGWCPCVTPSSLSIIVAYYMVCYRYGIPITVLFDNGKDYHSKLLNGSIECIKIKMDDCTEEETEVKFSGIFHAVGSAVQFTRVYNGKSKGRQERYFRVLGEYLAKDMGSYVGSDSRTRPEEAQLMFRAINGMAKRNDIPQWKDFVTACNSMVEYINDHVVTQAKGTKGMTRSQAFERFLPENVRKADKALLQAALCKGEVRQVKRNGFTINGINYWHPDLLVHYGTKVIVRSSLVFDNKALVYTLAGKYICECEGNYFMEQADYQKSIERLEAARKSGFKKAAEIGMTEIAISEEQQTMVSIANNLYSQNRLMDIDELLLPQSGAKEEEKQKPESKTTKMRKHKSIWEETENDYMPDVSAG